MTPEQYQGAALRTLSANFYVERVPPHVWHAVMGLVTESGEMLDHLKRVVFYGDDYDPVNLIEEAGDQEWYLALLRFVLDVTQEGVQIANIRKLARRYPDKFDDILALARNLGIEREQLEEDTYTQGIIYLASPYSHPNDLTEQARFEKIAVISGRLVAEGIFIYSPITHNHPMRMRTELPGTWEFWARYDEEMIKACSELWVVTLSGWSKSKGVTAEIEIAESLRMRIQYVDPMTLERTDEPSS